MIPSPILRAVQEKALPEVYSKPYRAKRLWPPDFDKLSEKHQFRLERRYKRRVKLKWARPRWTKSVKIVQLFSVVGITMYGVLFMDWKQEHQPFQGIRKQFESLRGSIWTRSPERIQSREQIDVLPISSVK